MRVLTLSVNVTGLVHRSHRLLLFRLLKRRGWAVAVLQEPRHTSLGAAPVPGLEMVCEVAGQDACGALHT